MTKNSNKLSLTIIIEYLLNDNAISQQYSNYIQTMPPNIVSQAASIVQQRVVISDMNPKANKLLKEKIEVLFNLFYLSK